LGWNRGTPFAFQIGELGSIQNFAPGIRKQAIEDPGKVLKMKSHRSSASWPRPEQFVREIAHRGFDLVPSLKQRVGCGLEHRRNIR